jgi:NitT/TauT family transport system substrate-binding protein
MSPDTVKASWSQMTFTFDPLAPTMGKEADNAKSVGLLDGTVNLNGIYDLSILNQLLSAAGRPTVSDH